MSSPGTITGLHLAIVALIDLLHHQNVLPRDRAIAWFRQSADNVRDTADFAHDVRQVLRLIAVGLEPKPGPPDPSRPSDTRHLLQLLQGGRTESD